MLLSTHVWYIPRCKFCLLTKEEPLHRLDQRKIDILRSSLGETIKKRGIVMDKELHNDLRTNMTEMAHKQPPPGAFA